MVLPGEMAFKAVLYPKGDPPPADFDKEINDDWNDEFYKVPELFDALDDVKNWETEYPTLVVTCGGRFFGKVNIALDNEFSAIRIMYLYCAGWRRRAGFRKMNGFYSADIMWVFAARLAMKHYGSYARLFVIMPRDAVRKRLAERKAVHWVLKDDHSRDLILRELSYPQCDGILQEDIDYAAELHVKQLVNLA